MAKVLPPSRHIALHARVDNASHILKRLYVAERVLMRTLIGGTRILDVLAGEMLPRIC